MEYICRGMYSIQQRILVFLNFASLQGERKVPLHVSIELMNQTGHCKFRLDCRTKKANDGLLALPVHIPLDTVSVFPVSISLEGLPLKVSV